MHGGVGGGGREANPYPDYRVLATRPRLCVAPDARAGKVRRGPSPRDKKRAGGHG
jgi:hypothetical protein